jgi:queuine/archaeosine tRNA-ribosyltransferase
MLAARLMTLHNLAHYRTLICRLQASIDTGKLAETVRDIETVETK